jgi:hypothetical protein
MTSHVLISYGRTNHLTLPNRKVVNVGLWSLHIRDFHILMWVFIKYQDEVELKKNMFNIIPFKLIKIVASIFWFFSLIINCRSIWMYVYNNAVLQSLILLQWFFSPLFEITNQSWGKYFIMVDKDENLGKV